MNHSIETSAVAPIDFKMSARYVVIDSQRLICELQKRGFVLREILQPKTRKGFHTVRMRAAEPTVIGGEKLYPELIFSNSYNGTSAFKCSTGIFRLVCSNGLTVRATEYGGSDFKTRHVGSEAAIAEEMTVRFSDSISTIFAVQQRLAETKLTEVQAIDLAMKAAEIRWKKTFSRSEARKLLKAARPEDRGRSAWHVFNVLQERLIQGGVQLEGMKRMPKPITQVRTHGIINEQLFEAVYEMVGGGKTGDLLTVSAEQSN